MNTCDEFEIAIEMRNHGALSEGEHEALASHLGDCPSCRSFERVAKETDNAMSARALEQM